MGWEGGGGGAGGMVRGGGGRGGGVAGAARGLESRGGRWAWHLVVGEAGDAIGDTRHEQRLRPALPRQGLRGAALLSLRLWTGGAARGACEWVHGGPAHEALPRIAVVEVHHLHPRRPRLVRPRPTGSTRQAGRGGGGCLGRGGRAGPPCGGGRGACAARRGRASRST